MYEKDKIKKWNIPLTLVVSIVLAFSGYLYTYYKDLHLVQRKERLERISSQLRELYGPLYASTVTSGRIWEEFRKRNRPGKPYWLSKPPPTNNEAKKWRLWIKEVFMPMNLEKEKIILNNADLIVEERMPQVLLDLSAHVAAYKAIIAQWNAEDYSENTSFFDFPGIELRKYAEEHYISLKKEQLNLIGEVYGR